MGLFRCDMHGYLWPVHCCVHVYEARQHDRSCDIVVMSEPDRLPRIFCSACSVLTRDASPDVLDDEGAGDAAFDCAACLDAWLTKAGHGLHLAELFAFDGNTVREPDDDDEL